MIQKIATPAIARTATPPTTEPAMTPVLLEPPPPLLAGVEVAGGAVDVGAGVAGVVFGVVSPVGVADAVLGSDTACGVSNIRRYVEEIRERGNK